MPAGRADRHDGPVGWTSRIAGRVTRRPWPRWWPGRGAVRALTVPAGPLPRPGWRAVVVDLVVALAIALAAFRAATDGEPGGALRVSEDVVLGRPRPPALHAVVPPPPPVGPVGPGAPGEGAVGGPYEVQAVTDDRSGSGFGAALLVFVVCAPLVLRRRYPLAVLWASVGAGTLALLQPRGTTGPGLYADVVVLCLVAAYSAAAHSPFRAAVAWSLPVVALLVAGYRQGTTPSPAGISVPFLLLAPLVAGMGGHHVWQRRVGEDRQRLAVQAQRQAQALRDAVADERARIARELHDVVTHHVSVMVVQAGAARSVLSSAPGDAREAILAVESTGRSALTELRHVMGLLAPGPDGEWTGSGDAPSGAEGPPRAPGPLGPDLAGVDLTPQTGPAGVDLAPQPGLDGVPALVRRVREAGVPVALTVRGDAADVPSGVQLALYRVVQEALTNTVRHAGGARARVGVDCTPDRLVVVVTDTGPGPGVDRAPAPVDGGGSGLIGLRERLALYGGTLTAGASGAGYRVEAVVPLPLPGTGGAA